MPNGKVRSDSHLIDADAQRVLFNIFPREWVYRAMSPDYGIDFDLELFEWEDDKCVTLGEHLFLQVKGTTNASYIKIRPYDNLKSGDNYELIDVLSFSIDVSLLKLVNRMGSAIPVILIVVDTIEAKAYYVCLNDYIRFVLPLQNPKYLEQQTVVIHIPIKNIISDNHNTFRWYAKRPKLYGLFQQMLTTADDANYIVGLDLIEFTKSFIYDIIGSDAWAAKNEWPILQDIHNLMLELINNNMVSSKELSLVRALYHEEDLQEKTCYLGSEEREISAINAAQELSCRQLFDRIKTVCGVYESSAREAYLPLITSYI